MKTLCMLLLVLLAHGVWAGEAAAPVAPPTQVHAQDGATEAVYRASLKWFDDYLAQNKVDELVPAAEGIADRLIAGGNLYAGGDLAFSDDYEDRAGGMPATKIWNANRMAPNDVFLLGLLAQNDKSARNFFPAWIGQNNGRFTSALTVYLGSKKWPQVSRLQTVPNPERWKSGLYFMDTNAPEGADWPSLAVGQMATLAVSWALEVEIVAAASRKGKTLATYTSMFEPNSKEFNDKITGKTWVDDLKIEPIPAGKLGREYLIECRRQVAEFLSNGQAQQVRRAAERLAATQRKGGVIWTVTMGHLLARGAQIPMELTHLFFFGRAWQWTAPQGVQSGDTLLYIGYMEYPKNEVEACLKVGADAVVVSLDAPPEGPQDARVTAIRSCWERWDGVVTVPGYPYKAAPSSSVVQTPQWFSLMAEAQVLLR